MAVNCEMIVGYLVPHPCPNNGVAKCTQCGRRYCEEHVHITNGGLVCTACQQGLQKPVTVAATAKTFDEIDYAAFESVDSDDFTDDDIFADLS